jgi:hypothetical protein
MSDRLAEIKARWAKVLPLAKPWTPNLTEILCYFEDEGEPRVWDWDGTGRAIAAAPEDIAWLVAEVERLSGAGSPPEERRQWIEAVMIGVLRDAGYTAEKPIPPHIVALVRSFSLALVESRPSPPEGGRAPQELVAELEEALQRPQTASRYDELLLKCYEALRSRAEPEGERRADWLDKIHCAKAGGRWTCGKVQELLDAGKVTTEGGKCSCPNCALWRDESALRVPGARPDGGRKDDALEIEEDSGRTFHWDDS